MQLESFLFIFFISLLIFSIAISYLTIFAPPLFQFSKIYFWMIIPAFIMIVWFILISYWRAGCSDPGYPKQSLKDQYNHKQIENLQNLTLQQVQKKAARKQRGADQYSEEQIKELSEETFCFKCENIKQIRVHHCKVCNKCISRMDHHCPWVGNCVGKENHKYFLLFLMYATIGLCIVWITILIDWLTDWPIISRNNSQNKFYAIVLTGITAFGLSLPIGFLFVTQLFTSTINITTLQSFIPGIENHNPFDKASATENLTEIMGDNKCEWLLPTRPQWKVEYNNFGFTHQ